VIVKECSPKSLYDEARILRVWPTKLDTIGLGLTCMVIVWQELKLSMGLGRPILRGVLNGNSQSCKGSVASGKYGASLNMVTENIPLIG
jgi:hypothetical protein